MKKKMVKKKDLKKKKKKKKTNKIKNVFIVLLIFLSLMGILLLVALSHEDSDGDGALIDEVIQGEIQKLDLDNRDVKKLYKLFLEDSNFKIKYAEGLNNSVESRLYYTYLSFKEDDFDVVRCQDVGLVILYDENNYLSGICSLNTSFPESVDEMEKEIRENNTVGISLKDFKKRYVELFGDVKFSKEDFNYLPGQIMHYDSRSNYFLKYYAEAGSTSLEIEGLFKKAELRGRKLEITITYHVYDFDEDVDIYDVVYRFEKDKETNKFVFMSREEK